MTRDDRFIGQLEDYLDEFDGDTPLPGHVRDAVRAGLPGTRQVRPRRGPMRVLNVMNTSTSRAPWLVAAAAIVVAVIGGAWFLSGSRGDVGSVAPTVAPTAAPTTVPSASPVPSDAAFRRLTDAAAAPCDEGGGFDCIAAGTYALDVPFGGNIVVVDVPAGWFPWYPSAGFQSLLVDSGPDAPGGSGWGASFMRVGQVFRDPCDIAAGTYAAADTDTPAELAAAMGAWPGFTVSDPEPATLSGLEGVSVDVSAGPTLETCPSPSILQTPEGSFVDGYPMVAAGDTGRPAVFRILDAGDELLVVRTTEFLDQSPHEATQSVAPDPDRHADSLVQLRAMLDSVRLEPVTP